MILRGPSGLGDSVYMYPITREFMRRGEDVTLLSDFPDIFTPLKCRVEPYRQQNYDLLTHYFTKRLDKRTSQYQDLLVMAGLDRDLPMQMDTVYKPEKLVKKKLCLVRTPCKPRRGNPLVACLQPAYPTFQMIIDDYQDECSFVQIGRADGEQPYQFTGLTADLSAETDVILILKLLVCSDITLAQVGYMIPFCEALDKKLFCIFSRAGLQSKFIEASGVTPEKVFDKPKTTTWAVDDDPAAEMIEKFGELLNA